MRFTRILHKLACCQNENAFFLDSAIAQNMFQTLVDEQVKKWEKHASYIFYVKFTLKKDKFYMTERFEREEDLYSLETFVRNMNLYGFSTTVVKHHRFAAVIATHFTPFFNSTNPDFALVMPRRTIARERGCGKRRETSIATKTYPKLIRRKGAGPPRKRRTQETEVVKRAGGITKVKEKVWIPRPQFDTHIVIPDDFFK